MSIVHKNVLASIVGLIVLTVLGAIGINQNAGVHVTFVGAAPVNVQAVVYSAPWCGHCKPYLAALEKELPKDGWILRKSTDKDASTAHVVINEEENQQQLKADEITLFPTTVIKRDGRIVKRFTGYVKPDDLVTAFNNAGK